MSDWANKAQEYWDKYQWLFEKCKVSFNDLSNWLDSGYDLVIKKPYDPIWPNHDIAFAARDLHGELYVMERPADYDAEDLPDGLFEDVQSDELNDLMREY